EIARLQKTVAEQQVTLGEIYQTSAWKMVQRLWRVRYGLIPQGSRRERLVARVLRGVHSRQPGSAAAPVEEKAAPARQAKERGAPAAPPSSPSPADLYAQGFSQIQAAAEQPAGDEYVPLSAPAESPADLPLKLIAFYLPQYHPIPENDAWWGRGFTEWANVSKAVPQFLGHYQPHQPGELGFYDLRVIETQRRQVELARAYGIHGFCFYTYWFNGHRLLEKPLDQFVSDPEIAFPFCLCWANENWTRRWDGNDAEILIAQEHTLENDLAYIADIAPYLRHPNYIRVDGRPLVMVYRASLLTAPAETVAGWRQYCQAAGIGDLYLVAAQTFDEFDPRPAGFDAAVEFPPHNAAYPNITDQVSLLNPTYQGTVQSYLDLARTFMANSGVNAFRLFKTVCPAWDNEPRKPGRGTTFLHSTPALYRRWLASALAYTIRNHPPAEQFVFVNAWNEWGEGAHLEPDRKFGYAYLQATADALRSLSDLAFETSIGQVGLANLVIRHDTAVILHLYYTDLWDEICQQLEPLGGGFDLYVSLPLESVGMRDAILSRYPQAVLYFAENRGRDLAPFIQIYRAIAPLNYRYLLKIHAKKTDHRADGDRWRQEIYTRLLGSLETVEQIKAAFGREERLGLVGPAGHVLDYLPYRGGNQELVSELARKAHIPFNPDFLFIAGSMFWARPQALDWLNLLPIEPADFPAEPLPKDATLAHALERYLGLATAAAGYTLRAVGPHGEITDPKSAPAAIYPFAEPTA
ncbi:MAG TPA: glycoside hydrolase family 99-like domain-containing protein, partial [Anaerolineaceae bacterium]